MMSREEILYLVPYIFSLLLSLGIFFYTWRHRHVRGARTYAWFVGGQTLTILGFLLELLSPTLESKIFWDTFQWLTLSYLIILPFLLFTIRFSDYKLQHPELLWGPVILVASGFTALLLTDNIHHLIYLNPRLTADTPFPDLDYDFTYIVYVYTLLFIYVANLYGISLLIRRAIQPYNLYRSQYVIIATGFLVPLILSFFSLAGIRIAPQRDISPFSLAIGNLIVAWGLFRYGLFDIAPIAREHIVENMTDPVLVLDSRNRIVDINKAALTLMDQAASEVIGRTTAVAFATWPFIVELLNEITEQRREVSAQRAGRTLFFDISISHIFSRNQELIGRIVAARDITELKTLQINYQALSEELEQRVRERTEELHTSAERYRAVVENQTEFIVRWRPDGTRTFVNEAYCRYWGISYEQALAINFLFHVAEEDRPNVEEKIARLHAGIVEVETEIHRVIKPDGTIAWQEWTDQAIRDDWGKLIEIQSIGRDITERQQAQEALQKSEERFSKAFQASPVILVIFGIDTARIIAVNDTFEEISGFSREEVLGKSALDVGLWANVADRERVLSTLEAEGSLRSVELQFLTKDRRILTCLFSAEIMELGGEKCGLAVIEDITERKNAEKKLAEAYETTLEGWAKALELRDKETEGHSRRVTETTLIVARAMGFSEQELIHIRRGSLLHDIGKMGIPDEILRKRGPLTKEERMIVENHPDTALALLSGIPFLEKALEIPRCHHEKWDGSGYPCGLKGDEIPLTARIFAVVDVWDALSTNRPYRDAWSREQVIEYLTTQSGKHFDPKVVEVFLQLLHEGKI